MIQDKDKRLTNLFLPEKKGSQPLKRSMSGYELESFVLKNDGRIDSSDILLAKAKENNMKKVVPEVGKEMIEILCMPHKKLSSTSLDFVENLIQLSELAEKNNRILYPFGTYPGVFSPVIRKKSHYQMQKRIHGLDRFKITGKCCGYHQHYAMPRGVFDHKKKFLKYSANSKIKRTFLDSFNILNALDPVVTSFLQSSPFVDNKYVAKDSRVLLFRGGSKLNFAQGLFSKNQFFGALSPYKQTLNDLISTLNRRFSKWKKLVADQKLDPEEYCKEKDMLKYAWNPVKVNQKGTLELRSGDANYLTNIFAVSTMITFTLRKIQQDFMLVIPMDLDLKDSFKIENNMIFIPPHSVVRKQLQKASAYEGLKNNDVHTYANAFFKFVKEHVYKEYMHLLEPVKEMLDSKETLSDQMIDKAKKDGYKDEITDEYAKEFALYYAEKFPNDLQKAKEMLMKIND
ncbi:MAG: hypothetical protein ABIG89_06090 [Candidatus Woesearchaeota archaeon]